MTTPNVGFVRPELAKMLPQYQLIKACLAGEHYIKDKGELYLPVPDDGGDSTAVKKRFAALVMRAVFLNVTRRTLLGLLGQVFSRPPVITVPQVLKPLLADANGAGVDLEQLTKQTLSYTLAYSRSGLFVDFPTTEGGASRSDIASGKVRPVIYTFSPEEIVNWRVTADGSNEILSLVVLAEAYPYADDGFELKHACQYRILRIDKDTGNYTQQVVQENEPTEYDGDVAVDHKKRFKQKTYDNWLTPIVVTGGDGLPLKKIPFMFVGSLNNDSNIDNPNMYDIASVNMAHYRNSADYEEYLHMLGQPTLVMTGLTETWVTDQLGGKVRVGSRGGIPLPENANAFLLEVSEHSQLKDAMDQKEKQMVALGAKLVENRQVQRTATETKMAASAEGSILASCTRNVTAAYLWALQTAAMFINETGAIEFKLNTDFEVAQMTPQEQQQIIADWQEGAITWIEMRTALKRAGIATQDDEQAKKDIAADMEVNDQRDIKKAIAIGAANQNAQAAKKLDNNTVVT